MATECIAETVPHGADVTVRIIPKAGGRRLRVIVEYDDDLVETVEMTKRRIDPQPSPAL